MLGRLSFSSLTAAAIGAVLGTSAFAADLPIKAPAYAPAQTFNWTGFYLGGHVGAGWGKGDSELQSFVGTPLVAPLSQTTVSGFLGGVQAGYNWQVSPMFVLGVEGDFSWADLDGSSACAGIIPFPSSCGGTVKWMADFTGRAGVTIDRALVYLKGGIAWAKTEYRFTPASVVGLPAIAVNDTRTGALLGLGVEYAVSRNWSAKVEYNYIDFGKENETFVNALGAGATAVTNIDQQLHVVKAGMNYRF